MLKKIFSRQNLPILLIVLVALFFRLKNITTRDVWYDEVLTIMQSEKGLLAILHDVPTPVHYIFVYIFLFIGKSTQILGLPSVIFGIATIFLLIKIVNLISSKWHGYIAAMLLAISPMHIEFSQQILFFSYYTFFSLLSLYFLLLFIDSSERGKFSWQYLLLCGLVNCVNVLTQMVGLVVLATESIFLITYVLLTQRRILKKILSKKSLLLIFLMIVGITCILTIGSGGYINLISKEIKFDLNKPITVGYSLSSQIHSTVLNFNLQFFKAMFSWFGIGGGIRLYLYLSLFAVGVCYVFRRVALRYAILLLFWLAAPFIFLYLIRLNHWFEEKYFIFMIPVYLFFVSAGVLGVSETLTTVISRLVKKTRTVKSQVVLKAISVLILTIIIFIFSLHSIYNRTTFGFNFAGHTTFNWREVYKYFENNLNPGDKIWLPKKGTLFLDYYFGIDKEKYLYDELSAVGLDYSEYSKLVGSSTRNYFVTIPDFKDLYLARSTSYKSLVNVGGFNIYEFKFSKKSPVIVTADNDGKWEYYDDFSTSMHLSDAMDRKNMVSSYAEADNTPRHEGFNVLTPKSFSESSISYRFKIDSMDKQVYFQPLFSIDDGITFKVFITGSSNFADKVYEQKSNKFKFFQPTIPIVNSRRDGIVELKIVFDYDKGKNYFVGGAQLKSIRLSNKIKNEVSTDDYSVSLTNNLSKEYKYDSELEVVRSNKWVTHALQTFGWVQTNEGFLIKGYGDNNEEYPLVYKYKLPEKINNLIIDIKAFAHYTNPLKFEYSLDGNSWKKIAEVNDNLQKIYTYKISDLNSSEIYIRFKTRIDGPSSQIRNFDLSFNN